MAYKNKSLIAACLLFIPSLGAGTAGFDWDRFLAALQKVESGGVKNPDTAVGDNGKALGRYQLHQNYVLDAKAYDGTLVGSYRDIATHPVDSGRAVTAYLTRYGRADIEAGNIENLAKKHNGGPTGHKKKATEKYWKKFKSIYDAI
jgi:hypothetical protein